MEVTFKVLNLGQNAMTLKSGNKSLNLVALATMQSWLDMDGFSKWLISYRLWSRPVLSFLVPSVQLQKYYFSGPFRLFPESVRNERT